MDDFNNELRNKIINDLTNQGFEIFIDSKTNEAYLTNVIQTKSEFRKIFEKSKVESKTEFKEFLIDNYEIAKNSMAESGDIDPEKIDVELIEVKKETIENILLRWWNLVWWSNPFQPAIYRRMKYLLWDKYHNNLIGLLILQSNVISQKARDDYLKLTVSNYGMDYYNKVLNNSLYGQRIGAIPPYNQLLGGKLVAYSMLCNGIRNRYIEKYTKSPNLFESEIEPLQLLYISTTSMFGRSSIYNRMKYYDEKVGISLGYSGGFGTFQFSDEICRDLKKLLIKKATRNKESYRKSARKLWWTTKGLEYLKLGHLTEHTLKKEYFIFPMVDNLLEVIHDKEEPIYKDRTLIELVNWWKNRWAIPRAERMPEYKNFNREQYFKDNVDPFILKLNKEKYKQIEPNKLELFK